MPVLFKENSTYLRNMLDTYLKNSRSLEVLGEPVHCRGSLLLYLIVSKFDSNTRKHWDMENDSRSIPTLKRLESFLRKRCDLLETIARKPAEPAKKYTNSAVTNDAQGESGYSCYFCSGNHAIFKCEDFQKMNALSRRKEVLNKRLCFCVLERIIDQTDVNRVHAVNASENTTFFYILKIPSRSKQKLDPKT